MAVSETPDCPICGRQLVLNDAGTWWVCQNTGCTLYQLGVMSNEPMDPKRGWSI